MSPRTKRAMKSGSSMSKKPKLYDTGPGKSGSSTTIALWPKRSKKISPGCMVATPMRGAASAGSAQARRASSRAPARRRASVRVARGMRSGPADMPADARRDSVAMDRQVQRVQPARVGAGDAEAEAAQRQLFAGFRQVADGGSDQAADGVVLVVVEVGAEALVEVVDRGQRIDDVLAVGLGGD